MVVKLIFDQFITTGDALSQLIGRWIPVRYEGRWHRFTRSANESISGAADWHRENGRWPWVASVIDGLFSVLESDHCAMSRIKDQHRAIALLKSNGYEVRL